jgi:hypothetical protein
MEAVFRLPVRSPNTMSGRTFPGSSLVFVLGRYWMLVDLEGDGQVDGCMFGAYLS